VIPACQISVCDQAVNSHLTTGFRQGDEYCQAPPKPGTVPDSISDFIAEGRWQPAEKAQAPLVNAFKKEHGMK
jgi:hypothetical protein